MASSPPTSEGASSSSSGATAVIIACAVADTPVIGEVSRSLAERGHDVEVVTGANANSDLLALTVHKFDRQGLYVLCRSTAMERAAVDQLRAVLRKEGVPFGRTLTLALDSGPAAARALEDRILSVARRMVTGRGDAVPVNSPAILPPPTTKVTKVPMPPAEMGEEIDTRVSIPSADSAPFAAPTAEQMQAAPDPVIEADVDAWADSLAGQPIVSDFESHDQTSVDQAVDFEAIGTGAPEPTTDAPSEALSAVEVTQPRPLLSLSSEAPAGDDFAPSGVDRTQVTAKSESMLPPAPPGRTRNLPPPTTPPVNASPPVGLRGPSPMPPAERSQGSMEIASFRAGPSRTTMLMVGGALAAVAILITVVLVFRGGDTAQSAEDKVAAAHKNTAANPTPEADDEAAKANEEEPPDEAAGGEEPVGEAGEDPAGEEPVAEDTADPGDVGGDRVEDPGEEPADDPPAEPAGDTPPTPPPGPAEVEDAQVVLAALQSREVRALDTFLVTAESTRDISFERAEAYCADLEVAGLSSWRLPSIGELNSLVGAKLFRTGLLWSSTLGDAFGDQRLVLNLKKERIAPVSSGWDGASAVCIRERS